ncbi:MAG: RIP metalloprotease RseP [Cyclobacteriaceae bacterium]
MEGLIMAAQILLSLSILVGLHEMGHLLAAKLFDMRVEQFSIGFPPKVFSFKYGETEYALSAIPLGGFVKISGMIDESLDTEKMKEPPKPYEFRSKPAWQRLIVMLGGIIVNVITGVVIFIFLTFIYGETYISNDWVNENGGIMAFDLAQELGLETGDKIVKINGEEFRDFQDVYKSDVFLEDDASYTVLRNGQEVTIPIPGDFIERMNSASAAGNFLYPRVKTVVGEIAPGSIAEQNGMQPGDEIKRVAGIPVEYHDQVSSVVKGFEGDTISVTYEREGQLYDFKANFRNDSIIGYIPVDGIQRDRVDFTFGEAIPYGTKKAFNIVFLQVKAFGKMLSGAINPAKSLAGPFRIAQAYGGEWIWERFWFMTGLLSMVLAFMNLLPIPALDGGPVMFLTYEMISGHKPSDKFLENAQKIGMILLLALMVFVIFNDIFSFEGVRNLFGID